MAIRQRSAGSYEISFECGGQRVYQTVAAANEREARRLAKSLKAAKRAELTARKAATRHAGSTSLALHDAFERYYHERTGGSLLEDGKTIKRPADQVQIRDGLNLMLGYFDALSPPIKLITQLDDAAAIRLTAWRAAQYRWGRAECGLVTPAQVNRSTVQVLQRVFTHARRIWKLELPNAPDFGKKNSKVKLREPRKRKRILLDSEDIALAEALPEGYEKLRRFSIESVLRQTESLLRWKDYDGARRIVTVRIKGRDIVDHPLSSAACAIIESCRGDHPVQVFTYLAERTRAGKVKGRRYPITKSGLHSAFSRACARAGVTGYKWHDNRRTGASEIARAYGPVHAQEILHHANIGTTMLYVVLTDAELQEAVGGAGDIRRARIEAVRAQMAADAPKLLQAQTAIPHAAGK